MQNRRPSVSHLEGMVRRVTTKARGPKGTADRYFSLLVRAYADNRCENCGTTTGLTCAHIMSRTYSQTRCDFDNAFCLCFSCHEDFTKRPIVFGEFVREHRTAEQIERITSLARKTDRVWTQDDWREIARRLSAEWKAWNR